MSTYNDKLGIPGNPPAFDTVDVISSFLERRILHPLLKTLNSRMRTLDRACDVQTLGSVLQFKFTC